MTKFSKILILSAVIAPPLGVSANASDVHYELNSSTCKIKDKKGDSRFRARGNCEEVSEAYEKWKKLNSKEYGHASLESNPEESMPSTLTHN
ncbi:MAG: hypothetical protein OXH57_09815 [Ekhidna sp.]|nr:hypothetical protein [Ekhidna sp.]